MLTRMLALEKETNCTASSHLANLTELQCDGIAHLPSEYIELAARVQIDNELVLPLPVVNEADDAKLAALSEELQKATISTMAVGICQEIRNPLFSIQNYAAAICQYLARRETNWEVINELANDIYTATQRASKIINGLRPFTKQITQGRVTIPISEIIEESLNDLEMILQRRHIRYSFNNDPMAIVRGVDRTQIHQVLVNLLIYAMDSMNDKEFEQGQIHVETIAHLDQVEVIIDYAAKLNAASLHDESDVSDQAMPTNKSAVDLSICRAIIESNDGSLRQANKSSQSASFHVFLPRGNYVN